MTIVEEKPAVTGGVDTHSEVHVAAALDPVGGLLGTRQFPATAAGYASLRERLLAALPTGGLASLMSALAVRRGIREPAPPWQILPERDGGRQSERTAQYRCMVRAPDAAPALTAEARLVLPDGYQRPSVQASAALKIQLAPSEAAGGGDTRMSITDLVDILAAAWGTAVLIIPLTLVEDPVIVPLSGPPVAELYVRAGERYAADGRPEYKELPDVVDLSPLGEVAGSQLRQGGIGVSAPVEASAEERRLLVRQAIIRMAVNQWGFIEANEDLDL